MTRGRQGIALDGILVYHGMPANECWTMGNTCAICCVMNPLLPIRLLPPVVAAIHLATVAAAPGVTINARDCSAAGDGERLDTKAIQAALDKCAGTGGGVVLLKGGRFLSGTLYLRSHVPLRIEAGATLLGSTNIADYPHNIPAIRSYTENYVNQAWSLGKTWITSAWPDQA
jgi:hypothetical protein